MLFFAKKVLFSYDFMLFLLFFLAKLAYKACIFIHSLEPLNHAEGYFLVKFEDQDSLYSSVLDE